MITITIIFNICLGIAQQHDNGWNFFYLKIARQSQNIAFKTVFNQPFNWLGGFATVHLFKSQHCVLFCIVKIKFTFQHWIFEKPVQPPVVFYFGLSKHWISHEQCLKAKIPCKMSTVKFGQHCWQWSMSRSINHFLFLFKISYYL